MTSLGEKVRMLRKERKLTQERLAKGITSASMISQIESDRTPPSAHLLQELAHRLKVNPSYLQQGNVVTTEDTTAYQRAKILMDEKLYAQAVLYLKPLLSAQPADSLEPEAVVYFDAALCYIKLERYTEAARIYEQCINLCLTKQDIPTTIYSYYYLGHLYFRLNTHHLARMYWQRAEALLKHHPHPVHPLTLKVYVGLARAQSKLKLYKLAEQNYQQAKQQALQSKSWLDAAEIQEELAETYTSQGLLILAEEYLTKAKDLYSVIHHQQGILQSSVKLAIQQRLKGEYQSAVAQLKEVLTSVASSPLTTPDGLLKTQAYYELAACYTALGLNSDASEMLSLLEELLPVQATEQWRIKLNLLRAKLCIQKQQIIPAVCLARESARILLKSASPGNYGQNNR